MGAMFESSWLWPMALILLPWAVRAIAPISRSPNGVPFPRTMHAVVDRAQSMKRIVIVGDVHGCLDELLDLLHDASFDASQDTLGDLVNKGPKSAEVVRWAREQGALCVRGNHDDSALSVLRRTGRWADAEPPSSYSYLRELSREDVAYLEELPYSLTIRGAMADGSSALIVHAGIVPGLALSSQNAGDLFKMRFVSRLTSAADSPLCAHDREVEGSTPWAQAYNGELGHIVFGHDAKRGLQQERFATGLDTGCCYGKSLTALILPERTLISKASRRVYAETSAAKQAQIKST